MYSMFNTICHPQVPLFPIPPLAANTPTILKHTKNFSRISNKHIRKAVGPKRNYMKFSPEKLEELSRIYEKNHYPSKDEMISIASKFSEKLSKIENWFKHKRRREVQFGLMKFEKKKVFSKEDVQKLMLEFLEDKNPNNQKYEEIAERLNCKVKHVKNWFSYKRKILLKLSRNPKLALKPKQEQILEKLLDETTSRLRKTNRKHEGNEREIKRDEATPKKKMEHHDEKYQIPLKMEEESRKQLTEYGSDARTTEEYQISQFGNSKNDDGSGRNSKNLPMVPCKQESQTTEDGQVPNYNFNYHNNNTGNIQEMMKRDLIMRNWIASQQAATQQQYLQMMWMGQMTQNYMQMCQNWGALNRFRGGFQREDK